MASQPRKPAKKTASSSDSPAAGNVRRTTVRQASGSGVSPSKTRKKPTRKFRIDPEPIDPARRFDTGSVTDSMPEAGPLPSGYGSGTVYLVAKDPHWLFCYWDIDWSKHRGPSEQTLPRLRLVTEDGAVAAETEVHPHARNWYLAAPAQGVSFTAEIGYADAAGWRRVGMSEPAFVPMLDFAPEGEEAEFATLPIDVGLDRVLVSVRDAMRAGESLMHTLARLQRGAVAAPAGEWTETQRRVLEAVLGGDVIERISMGSAEIEKVLRRKLEEHLGSGALGGFSSAALAVPLEVPGSASLFGGVSSGASWGEAPSAAPERSFFMHVNAEVIFYGGTHPDATVWINGREIALRPDGTFRYHFVFPDGTWEIPIVARSPDGVETRSARLVFERNTAREGDVGHTPQPPLEAPMGRRR